MSAAKKNDKRLIRKERIRKTLTGSQQRPRLAVFRSARYIYGQIIDDVAQKTVVACSSMEKELRSKLKSTRNLEAAKQVGKVLAERAKSKQISDIVFDRSGYGFHGRIKALAEGAREAGLKF